MVTTFRPLNITWELLPDDYILPDDPVDNRTQPALASALNEILSTAHRIPEMAITGTNYGICATVNGKLVIKAPDWFYIPQVTVPKDVINRSYTPRLQGDTPTVVMEFISHTEGGEYSTKPTYPPGKWFFYEQVLQVPHYIIFEPDTPRLEVYRLERGRYDLREDGEEGRYWIPELNLALGVWEGTWQERTGYWLRWWDEGGNLLLFGSELAAQAQQRAEAAQREAEAAQREAEAAQREAEAERRKTEQLLAQLRAAGLEPDWDGNA